jgi:hypothetical protein
MASLEKPITDAFELVYPKAKDGPAGEFLKDEARSDGGLEKAIAMTECAMLYRQGLNPHRSDLIDQAVEARWYKDVPDNELDATRYMLGLIRAIRQAVKTAAPVKVASGVKIANKVEAPAVVKIEEEQGDGKEEIKAKVDPKGS